MRDGRELEARELIKQAGEEFESLIGDMENMSVRNYNRMMRQRMEVDEMSSLATPQEFMKRGTESINRARRSKPDPRKES